MCFFSLWKGPYGDGANVDTKQLKPGVCWLHPLGHVYQDQPPPHLHTITLLHTIALLPPSQHHQPLLHLLHHFHITIALLPHIIIIFSSPSSDSLPSPECPLLDIKVILGDEGRYLTLMHLFKKELTSESFKPWKSVLWFTNE